MPIRSAPLYRRRGAVHNAWMVPAAPISDPAGSPVQAETGATLTIDLAAIEANWRMLARQLLAAECGAVVKADAYGLGLEPVIAKLTQAGCKTFFVADLAEARRVRAGASEATIYVLDGFAADAGATFAELKARPVINSITELAEWDVFCATQAWRGGAALQVDTGMNRLGISVEEAAALAPRVQTENHGITLLMSHLACAEEAGHPLTSAQIRAFREIRALYRGVPASLANSAGIFLGEAVQCDVARPGAALYGINPTPGKPNPMAGVVELTGRILQVRHVPRGASVGYGATWTAKRDALMAVVALGYADGMPRAASSTGQARGGVASIAGRLCPFAGRISMDLVCIDITELPNGLGRRGDMATFIGAGISIDDVAAAAATIGYEILTRLGLRCHIAYRDAQDGGG